MARKKSHLGRNTRQANRKRRQRANETPETRELRREQDRQSQTERRANETPETRELRREQDRQSQKERRARTLRRQQDCRRHILRTATENLFWKKAAFSYDLTTDYGSKVYIGRMDTVCSFCSARNWPEESQGMCCTGGKGKLEALQAPPEDVITADSIFDSSSIYENDFGDDEDSMEKAPPVLNVKITSEMTSLPSTSVTSTRCPYRPGPACSKKRRKPTAISVREDYLEDEFEASLSRALRVQTKIQKILTEERISDIGIITNLQATPSPTPPELVAPTFKPVASMYDPVGSAKLPEVSSSDTKVASVDSGFDSGLESTTTKFISGSIAGLEDIKTESIKNEPIFEIAEEMSTSLPASADSNSLPLQGQMEELKAPECVKPKDEIIHNEECEIVTLDEDDPLKGTGD